MGNYDYVFVGRFGNAPLARNAMANALLGIKTPTKGKRVPRTLGICKLLGLAPFTPHDLRRTAATMCGRAWLIGRRNLAVPRPSGQQDDNGKPLQVITRKVYNRATKIMSGAQTEGARCMGGRVAADRRVGGCRAAEGGLTAFRQEERPRIFPVRSGSGSEQTTPALSATLTGFHAVLILAGAQARWS